VHEPPQLVPSHVGAPCAGVGHDRHCDPHALTSSFTHALGLPQACWPEGHVKVHVVPLQAAVALRGLLQDAQVPPQQTSFVPHGVVSFTLVAPLQTGTPVEHDVVPV